MLPNNAFIRELFHIFFVNIYQHLLIWSFTLPMYQLYNQQDTALSAKDGLMTVLWAFFYGMEVIADRQMFAYQTKKYEWYNFKKDGKNKKILRDEKKLHAKFTKKDIEKYEIGFYHQGLYACSRHPNYFGEQGMWLSIYLWSAMYCGHNWSGIGAALLIALFQGSQNLAEKMSAEKYPLYRIYQQKVSSLIPWLPSPDLKTALKKKLNVFY